MSILIDDETSVVVQGITGREAAETVPEMVSYGTDVAAGVTPCKGGESVAGVPVYDTLADAVDAHPRIDTSLIYVPPFAAKDAAFEAMANDIDVINLITERVPVRDAHAIYERAERTGTTVVGPTSVGIISPGASKLGPIGGDDPESVYRPGGIGVISKSGGMTTETAWVIRQAGFGVSTAAGLGGDVIAGTTFADALALFETDDQTEAVVMFGELGGTYEQQAAAMVGRGEFTKPLVAFVAGRFTEGLPEGQYGHAGAIVREERDTPTAKAERLRDAGAHVVESHHRIAETLEAVV